MEFKIIALGVVFTLILSHYLIELVQSANFSKDPDIKFFKGLISLCITFLIFSMFLIDLAQFKKVPENIEGVSVLMYAKSDIYSSYRVTETDSTITINLYTKQDLINYLRED